MDAIRKILVPTDFSPHAGELGREHDSPDQPIVCVWNYVPLPPG
jgi:hypothetical protein